MINAQCSTRALHAAQTSARRSSLLSEDDGANAPFSADRRQDDWDSEAVRTTGESKIRALGRFASVPLFAPQPRMRQIVVAAPSGQSALAG